MAEKCWVFTGSPPLVLAKLEFCGLTRVVAEEIEVATVEAVVSIEGCAE